MRWLSQLFGGEQYDVFISYRRRLGSDLAQLVRRDLEGRGFRVFLDVRDMHAGRFDESLLRQVERSEHVVPVLTPGSLDRVGDPSDWMRREIAHALAARRHVVPLVVEGFEFPPELPADVADLPQHQWARYSHEFSEPSIDRLSELLGKPRTPPASRWFTRKRVAIAGGVMLALMAAGLASECDTGPTPLPYTPAGPVSPVVPAPAVAPGWAGFCCDGMGLRRCALVAPLQPGVQCFCPGQGVGITCP